MAPEVVGSKYQSLAGAPFHVQEYSESMESRNVMLRRPSIGAHTAKTLTSVAPLAIRSAMPSSVTISSPDWSKAQPTKV